jgi:hypothetical protein
MPKYATDLIGRETVANVERAGLTCRRPPRPDSLSV